MSAVVEVFADYFWRCSTCGERSNETFDFECHASDAADEHATNCGDGS